MYPIAYILYAIWSHGQYILAKYCIYYNTSDPIFEQTTDIAIIRHQLSIVITLYKKRPHDI